MQPAKALGRPDIAELRRRLATAPDEAERQTFACIAESARSDGYQVTVETADAFARGHVIRAIGYMARGAVECSAKEAARAMTPKTGNAIVDALVNAQNYHKLRTQLTPQVVRATVRAVMNIKAHRARQRRVWDRSHIGSGCRASSRPTVGIRNSRPRQTARARRTVRRCGSSEPDLADEADRRSPAGRWTS